MNELNNKKENGLTITAVVFAGVSWIPVLGWLTILPALVLSIVGVSTKKKSACSWVGLGLSLAWVLFTAIGLYALFNV